MQKTGWSVLRSLDDVMMLKVWTIANVVLIYKSGDKECSLNCSLVMWVVSKKIIKDKWSLLPEENFTTK